MPSMRTARDLGEHTRNEVTTEDSANTRRGYVYVLVNSSIDWCKEFLFDGPPRWLADLLAQQASAQHRAPAASGTTSRCSQGQ